MSDDMKAAVIIDEPNFLLQAMQVMDSFYNREPGENTAGWINRPLVNKDKFTLPILIALVKGTYKQNLGASYLAVAISIVPIMIAFVLFSNYIIAGVTAGALKE